MLRIKEKGYNFEQSPIRMKGDTKNKSRNPCPQAQYLLFWGWDQEQRYENCEKCPMALIVIACRRMDKSDIWSFKKKNKNKKQTKTKTKHNF